MINPKLFSILVLLFASLPFHVFAQFGGGGGIKVSVGPTGPRLTGFGNVDIEKTVQYWVEMHNNRTARQVELQLQRINEICQLGEKDASRLRFVVKGVISRRTSSASRQIKQFVYDSGLVERPSGDEQNDVAIEEDEMEFFSATPKGEGVVALGAEFKQSFTEHPLWIVTLEKTLTPQQLKAYNLYRFENSRRMLYLAIDVWVATLDANVPLSAEQRSSVTDRIRNELTPKVTTEFPATIDEASELVNEAYARDSNSLGELLTETQTDLRKTLLFQEPGPKASWSVPKR